MFFTLCKFYKSFLLSSFMGFIRGGTLVIVSVLFFIALLVGGVLLTLGNSLEYENIQQGLVPVVMDLEVLEGLTESVNENYESLVVKCQNSSEVSFEDYINLSCDKVSEGPEAISKGIIDDAINEIYYTEYNCGFFDCESQDGLPLFVVSEHSKKYFGGLFFKSLLAIVVLLVLLLLLTEKKSNGVVISGILLIVASLPFAKLEWIVSLFARQDYWKFLGFLFTSSSGVCIKLLVLGLILLVVGIILKFFAIGFKIQGFFEKFNKNSRGTCE